MQLLLSCNGNHHYSILFLDSGSLSDKSPPTASMAAVRRIGMALLTAMKLPNATLPKMAAIRPRHDRNPNAVVLEKNQT